MPHIIDFAKKEMKSLRMKIGLFGRIEETYNFMGVPIIPFHWDRIFKCRILCLSALKRNKSTPYLICHNHAVIISFCKYSTLNYFNTVFTNKLIDFVFIVIKFHQVIFVTLCVGNSS